MLIGVGVSCRISYSVVSYLYIYVSFSGLISSVGEESASFSSIVFLLLCGFLLVLIFRRTNKVCI